MSALRKTIFLLALFSIAMGFLEAAVVIYLRQIYYPGGFLFPLVPIPPNIALVEFLREAATIIMLLMVGIIAGKNMAQRFSFFLFCFAVWDIFYYVFLKVFIDWPPSLFTWDILFVIPVPWVGPVLAPCLVSLTMIVLTVTVVYFHERDVHVRINIREWLFFIVGGLTVIISFTQNYLGYIYRNNDTTLVTPMSGNGLFSDVSQYTPQSFNWILFLTGEVLLMAGIIMIVRRHRRLFTDRNPDLPVGGINF